MNRNEYERLVEHYLDGAMSPAEEQEFFIRVAVDSNLRQTLKAHRIVESALRKHRDALPAQHLESRTKLISMLGPIAPGHAAAGSQERFGKKPSGMLRRILPHAMQGFGWSLAAVAAVALAIGAFVIAPILHRVQPVRTEHAVRAASPQTASPRTATGSSIRIEPTSPELYEHPVQPSGQASSPATAEPHKLKEIPMTAAQPRASVDALRGKHRTPAVSNHANEAIEIPAQNQKHGHSSKPRYVARDTIRIPVMIDLPK